MKKILDLIADEVGSGFEKCGYDAELAKVTLSNRPDLCEYQCNGAMAAAKKYHKAPMMIAGDVVEQLQGSSVFEEITAVNPGFINIKISGEYLAQYLQEMTESDRHGCGQVDKKETIIIDYGGPNVAKPLHVGHLRSAVIGESVKRIFRYVGNEVIGDVHLGDWGLQMGLIIEELKQRKPDLIYFDSSYSGPYPSEAPFTISELEEIYPCASAKAKVDEEFAKKAHDATFLLQNNNPGYIALWNHILNVSVNDLKKNYDNLNVSFDLWKKESDAQPYIPDMIKKMKDEGYARQSDGALVVDVKEDSDTKEIPPCILIKSDGATLYSTTDLATLVEREKLFSPDRVLYVVDKRQEMHFIQVFRCAKKTGIVRPEVDLEFLGFGTMNGKDGKPFKTRDGGVMRLEFLIKEISDAVYDKIMENRSVSEDEARKISKIVGLAALKYGDLSNQASKDYIFDVERFSSFEGNTGPYILYTIVRIKSILSRYNEAGVCVGDVKIAAPEKEAEKALQIEISKFNEVIWNAYNDIAPHKICQYIYGLSDAFNRFYHDTKILSEEDENRKAQYIKLITLTKDVLTTCIDLLGFEAPDRM